jgi:hypothetical protein
MESPGSLLDLPPSEALREGQRRIVEAVTTQRRGVVTAQLPTGYGKTRAATEAYAALHRFGDVNRLLYIVPTDAQRRQFVKDGQAEFRCSGMNVQPFDLSYSPTMALREHRNDKTSVYVTTIQALAMGQGEIVRDLMQTGRWMIVIDEFHHYGIDKAWTRSVMDLPAQLVLAMSATPYRKDDDSAFGAPTVTLKYRDALQERAVKALQLHAYEYRVDAITVNGERVSFTTSEVAAEVGSVQPNAIDEYVVRHKMRWSPQYVTPLVTIPLERLITRRLETGLPLQMIVGAMGCLHAQMVFEQVAAVFGELLRIDWVGTGPNGRPDEVNQSIIAKFCPRKVNGRRRPEDVQLDILIHVGMAGEGLDSVYVVEVVHLNPASINNSNHQENGRASRRLPISDESQQYATINVDSSSPYAAFIGDRVMDLLDAEHVENDDDSDQASTEPVTEDYKESPDEPRAYIANCELVNIDRGDPEVRACADMLAQAAGLSFIKLADALADTNHPLWDRALELRRRELIQRAAGLDRMATLAQLKANVESITGKVASLATRLLSPTTRFDRSLIGQVKKRINQRKKGLFGEVENADEKALKDHYAFVKGLERELLHGAIPSWLR